MKRHVLYEVWNSYSGIYERSKFRGVMRRSVYQHQSLEELAACLCGVAQQ